MKTINYLYFVCVISFFMFSRPLSANEMCTNPVSAICAKSAQSQAIKKNYINQLKTEINTLAHSRIEGLLKTSSPAKKAQILKKKNFFLNQEKIKIAQSKLQGVEKAIKNPKFKVQLDELFKIQIAKSAFPLVLKQEMLATIAEITIMDFSNYVEFKDLLEDAEAQAMNPCGNDGLSPNAFSINHLGTLAVVICPGFVIENTLQIESNQLFEKLIFVLAHEMAHHLDTQYVDVANYKKFSSCLNEKHATSLKASTEDKTFCQKKSTSPSLCKQQIVDSHVDEIIADAWGFQILSEYIKRKSFSFDEINHLIGENLKNICGSIDDGYHPSSDFRLKRLLKSHPEINKSLGCSPSDNTLYCSF